MKWLRLLTSLILVVLISVSLQAGGDHKVVSSVLTLSALQGTASTTKSDMNVAGSATWSAYLFVLTNDAAVAGETLYVKLVGWLDASYTDTLFVDTMTNASGNNYTSVMGSKVNRTEYSLNLYTSTTGKLYQYLQWTVLARKGSATTALLPLTTLQAVLARNY